MEELDLIRQKIDIVSFISEYLPLKKAGRNFKANCPFHSERSPSFIVSPERQIWHCFGGCQIGGDIFSFLMKYENIEFPEALRILAKKAGVTLSNYQPTDASRLKDRLYEINHLASEYYHYLLTKHPVGKKALDYILNRGITKKSIETYDLGYAPNLWDGLIKFLVNKKKYRLDDLDKAGLIIRGKSGYYDRFRGRLMFTLKDQRGNIVGFAGRVLPPADEKQAKYINSPETPIYIKGKTLFGLDVNHEAIKKENKAVIVEGEIDAIASFQAGIPYVVAIKGSALTEEQVNLLKRYTDNLLLALDMDLAGDSAARRGIEIAENAGLDIKVVELPFGKDPAECAIKSPELWKKAVKEAVSVFDYLLSSAVKRYGKDSVEGKRKIAKEFLASLAKIDNEIIKAHFVKKLSRAIDIPEESINNELNKALKNLPVKKSEVVEKTTLKDRDEVIEEYLLSILLQSQRTKIIFEISRKFIAFSDFKNPATSKIFQFLTKFFEKNQNFKITEFAKTLPEELMVLSDQLYLTDIDKISKKDELEDKEIEKSSIEIKRLSLKRQIKDLTDRIEKQNDENSTKGLEDEYRRLTTKLCSLPSI